MIDTHSHIYSEEFDNDRNEIIRQAKNAGVQHIILPNTDSESLPRLLELKNSYPDFFSAAIGLHPTSVNETYETELLVVKSELSTGKYVAVGEIGIDLFWDKSKLQLQKFAFEEQLNLSLQYNLPVIIHVRNSFDETFEILENFRGRGLTGIFHSFTGTAEQLKHIIDFGGFYLGINGIVTFKNSGLSETLKQSSIDYLVLETDAPYLAPVPYRGKRNEPHYIIQVRNKLSEIFNLSEKSVTETTNRNAFKVFGALNTGNNE